MIVDANEFADGEALTADICIVGAGAVGIAMALDLCGSGLDVLVLEAGGSRHEDESQSLYAGLVADAAMHSPPNTYRERRLGGSTTTWGGRSMPFDPIDFERRDYMAYSDWPIGRSDLEPFYPKANRLCEAGDFAYTAETAFDRPLKPMIEGFSGGNFTTNTLERFSCPTDFGRRYRDKLAAAGDIRVVLHANVVHVALDPAGGRVDHLALATLQGRRMTVKASHVVLANGGLEATRLLLASRDVHKDGIGNRNDILGRHYMCHLAGTIGRFQFNAPVWNGYDIADDGTYCRRRVALRPEAQRRLGLGNVIGRLHHPRITDPAHRNGVLSMLYLARAFIPYEYGKRLHGGEVLDLATKLRHVVNVATDLPATVEFMLHLLRDRRLAERKFPSIVIRSKARLYSLDFHAEQEANPASRVSLAGERDALGLPRLLIDWRYTAKDVETVKVMLGLLAEDVLRSGAGRFDYDPECVETEMTRYGAYGGHHIGTTRMSASPGRGIVDGHCAVHGVPNLHVASASVFPTSSQANPTLTVVALGLRLADRLKSVAHRRLVATRREEVSA